MNTKHTLVVGLLLAGYTPWCVAGNLEPSGPPAPTMKTLAEVEPRTPIHASDLPLTIASPGSYYLAGDVDASGTDGITIAASGVTLDLQGFRLCCGTGDGVFVQNGVRGTTIRNGTVSNWAGSGVASPTANPRPRGWLIEDLHVRENGAHGILAGDDAIISRCVATDNGTEGIQAATRSVIAGCVAHNNAGDGFVVSTASEVRDSVASTNGDDGIRCSGVLGCQIRDNTARGNDDDGIEIDGNSSFVTGNLCVGNGADTASGAGIEVIGDNNRIERNNVIGNDRGVDLQGAGNFALRNTASDNGSNFSIVAGNAVGPIVSVAGVGDISGTSGSDHPSANFEF